MTRRHSQDNPIPAVMLEMSAEMEAEFDRRLAEAIEIEREQARMRGNLQAFETKLVGDLIRRQTREFTKFLDVQRRMEGVQKEELNELRAIKASMADLAKTDETQESIRDLLREMNEGIQTLVMMKSNGHATH